MFMRDNLYDKIRIASFLKTYIPMTRVHVSSNQGTVFLGRVVSLVIHARALVVLLASFAFTFMATFEQLYQKHYNIVNIVRKIEAYH